MTRVDQYGLPLTTGSSAATEAYVEALDLLLCGRAGVADRLVRALELDPGFAMAHAALAFQGQFGSDAAASISHILLATHLARHVSPRERGHIEALHRAVLGGGPLARRATISHLREFPRDALIIREFVLLNSYGGEIERKATVAAELGRLAPHFGADPWFYGQHSLALCEVGEIGVAAALAEAGLAVQPDHVVPAHSLAHIHFETGDDRAGRDFLEDWMADHAGPDLLTGHLSWHLALTDLAQSEAERALERYHDHKAWTPSRQLRLEDAISLLWRLHLRGVDVRGEWEPVLELEPSAGPSRAFEVAHVGFALAGAGDLDGLQRLGVQVAEEIARHPQQPFVYLPPLIEGLRLVTSRRWADAARALEEPVLAARRLGGSNEQHTVFDETLAVAYRNAGRTRDARRLEEERLGGRRLAATSG
jgi:hypothetical protein